MLRISALMMLVSLSLPAQAQLLKYNSKQEVAGAAMVSPDSTRKIIERLVKECAQHGDALQQAGDQALQQWLAQHQPLVDENFKIREEVLRKAAGAEKQQYEQFFTVQVPQMVDGQYKAISSVIDSMPTKEAKARVCTDYIGSVKDGKWDLRANDPVVFGFLQNRIAARNKPR